MTRTDSNTPTRAPSSTDTRPAVTVDLVIFSVIDSELKVLLHQREDQPFRGTWSLPSEGLRVRHVGDQGESIEDAAQRTLTQETGLPVHSCFMQQLHTFGRAGRDPRMRVISIAWVALVRPNLAAQVPSGDRQTTSQWFSVSEEVPWMRLAFDHAEILAMGAEQVGRTIDDSSLACRLVPHLFTVAELQSVYETTQHRRWDPRNFRRRFQRMVSDGIIVESPGKRHRGKARPANVWRFAHASEEPLQNKASG